MATAAVGFVALAPQQKPAPQPSPAPQQMSGDALRCKRRINFAYATTTTTATHHHLHHHQPASVARRNARERNRVKQVNNGFATLRQHIPASVASSLSPTPPASTSSAASSSSRAASKKLSKVETLRMAVEYIRGLQRLLEEHSAQQGGVGVVTTTGVPAPHADADHGYCSASPNLRYRRGAPSPDAASSPAPSFASEGSASGSASTTYGADNGENYEPMSPEDEELLDVISWWQQSQ